MRNGRRCAVKKLVDGDFPEAEAECDKQTGLPARRGTLEEMREKTCAWNEVRNRNGSKIDRLFTTADARFKLTRLYPQFERCWDTRSLWDLA
jgi:hypothetical protein